jgi:hypothetical protein
MSEARTQQQPQDTGAPDNVIPFPRSPQLAAPGWFAPVERQIRQAEGTASGSGNVYYGGEQFTPGHDFPQWEGAQGPHGLTHAAGPGQWQPETWAVEQKRAAQKGVDLAFDNPEHQRWAMFDLADRTYKDHTGRSLEADQKAGKVNLAAMSDQWEGLGSRDAAGTHRELQSAAFGGFNPQAQGFANAMIEQVRKAGERYDTAIREAKEPRDLAMALERKMIAESMKPPQNMHESWNTWGGLASVLALLGGAFGRRHMNAALGAAGEMMQAATQADRGDYDRAYARWKDQRDFGMRAVEMMLREHEQIIGDASKSYDHQVAELTTLQALHQLPSTLDHKKVAELREKVELEKGLAELGEKQNTAAEERNAVQEKDDAWERLHPGERVPADTHNYHVGEVKRARAGTVGTPQLLTDPKTGQQFTMVPGHPETAQTLTGEPYAPSGAQRVGTGAQAPPNPQTVESTARAIAAYQLAPLSGQATRTPYGQQVMSRVFELNGEYDQSRWQAKVRGEVGFTAGKEAGAIRSFSVAIDHLNTMEEAGEALANSDIQALNRLKNRVQTEFGLEGPVDFNFVKSIVGSEVSKAVVGGVGALADREELRVNLDAANSPEQLLGVIKFAKKLMAGQLSGYRLQSKNIGMSDEEFDRHLSPAASRS